MIDCLFDPPSIFQCPVSIIEPVAPLAYDLPVLPLPCFPVFSGQVEIQTSGSLKAVGSNTVRMAPDLSSECGYMLEGKINLQGECILDADAVRKRNENGEEELIWRNTGGTLTLINNDQVDISGKAKSDPNRMYKVQFWKCKPLEKGPDRTVTLLKEPDQDGNEFGDGGCPHPWFTTINLVGSNKARICPGTLNNMFPEGMIGEVTLTSMIMVVGLFVKTDGSRVTEIEYVAKLPHEWESPACTRGASPTEFWVPLAMVDVGLKQVYQIESRNLVSRIALCKQTEKVSPAVNTSPYFNWWTWITGAEIQYK